MLKVTCDCGRQFQVSEQEAGKRGACPCGQAVQIPGPPMPETVSLTGLEYETSKSRERPSDGIGSPRAGDLIGPYALVRKLGRGEMAEVWLGRHERLDQEVAIKFLHAHVSRDQDKLRRFMREAKLMAKLDHPHVVRVITLGDTGDHFYLVIEYVRGGSLEDHVRETGPIPWREATHAIRDAASGLAEAHRQGLIHRDIKPANLLRTPNGETKVSDFGLARQLTQGSELTHLGTPMGSPNFMAPEQWKGTRADERTDLYGLTCSYYYLLTGKPPFQAETLEAQMYQHLFDSFPDVRRELPTIPQGVERILQRGSQKDPDQRYQSALELLTDLEQLLGPEPASDSLATASRVPGIAAGLVLVIILGLAGLSWPLIRSQLNPDPRPIADNSAELTKSELSLPSTITNSIGMKLSLIPASKFQMGSPDDEPERRENEAPHPVRITKPYYMGVTEVTQEQYHRVMGINPSHFSPTGGGSGRVAGLDTRRFPVENVSWEDAVAFCEKLSALPEERAGGRAYRLPTEAEWEYACRAGTTTPFHFGLQLNGQEANCDGNYPYETTVKGPFLNRPTAVGSYLANDFGLYDMHGNVWEWCADWYGDYPTTMVEDPKGATTGSLRVIRGGCWFNSAWRARSAFRYWIGPSSRDGFLGFRLALSPLGQEAERPAR